MYNINGFMIIESKTINNIVCYLYNMLNNIKHTYIQKRIV